MSDNENGSLKEEFYHILNRRLRGIDNPILRELGTTEVLQDLLTSIHRQGYVKSFRYCLQIEDPNKEEEAAATD